MCRRSLFTVERTADDFPETVKRAQSGERELTYLLPPGSETLAMASNVPLARSQLELLHGW